MAWRDGNVQREQTTPPLTPPHLTPHHDQQQQLTILDLSAAPAARMQARSAAKRLLQRAEAEQDVNARFSMLLQVVNRAHILNEKVKPVL
jgi:hypothetical protein